MIEKIMENIKYSQSEKILTINEFSSIVSKKWEKVQIEAKNIKRLTEDKSAKLMEIFEEDLFVSFAPVSGGHQPMYLSNYIHATDLVSSIVHRYGMWHCNELQRWHNDLKNTDLYKIIDKQWSDDDLKYLQYICFNYSDYINAASYLFLIIFKQDGRYNILYEHFRKISEKRNEQLKTNEIIKNIIIDNQTDSDIQLKFIHHYLEIKIFSNNIPFGLALKTCKYSGIKYIEHFHISKYQYNHLYLPYCETISGWTTNYSNNKADIINTINENESLELLIKFCDKIEGTPSVDDWNFPIYTPDNVKELHDIWIRAPNSEYYKNVFGDFRAALVKANLIPKAALNSKFGTMCIAKDGHLCRSMAEQQIDNWLHKNNITHEIEPVYPKHDEYNKSGRMRADWKIGNNYVEYFGLPDDKKYAEKMQKKRNLANQFNINLIELYYYDLIYLDKSMKEKIINKIIKK